MSDRSGDDRDEGPLPEDLEEFGDDESADVAPCPACGAEIYAEADRCPYCGQYVTEPWRNRESGRWWLWGLAALAVLAALVAWLLAGRL